MKDRLLWLDIVKGIGIICVVVGHCTPAFLRPLFLFVYSFHMPLFFLVSGLCFNQQKYVDSPVGVFTGKRCRQLLIPLFTSCLLFWVISLVPGIDYYTTADVVSGNFPRAMWFVFSLFIVEMLYFFVNRWIKKPAVVNITICLLSLILALVISREDLVLTLSLSSIPFGLFYYTCGVMLRNKIGAYSSYMFTKPIKACITVLVLFAVVVAHAFLANKELNMCDGTIPPNEFITLLVSCCGIAMVVTTGILLSRIKDSIIARVLNYLGRNTLTILMFHLFFIEMSTQFLRPLLGGIGTEPLTVWFWLILIIPVVNRWLPWLVGKQR